MSKILRNAAAEGRQAVEIIERGSYVSPSGAEVRLAERIARAVAETRDYPEGAALPTAPARAAATATRSASNAPATGAGAATTIRVANTTSLEAARVMAERGVVPFVLNFASAKNPGGGFLGGAQAQEESLARASALYACIKGSPMYPHHHRQRDCMYTSWMIHSPAVPVFRDDVTGTLLDAPYDVAFLTAPAPNAGVVLSREPERSEELARVLASRIDRVLAIAAAHGHRHLVLGAWGCGVFRNDPAFVAERFRVELAGAWAGAFDEVVFAVLDGSADRRTIGPFAERFPV